MVSRGVGGGGGFGNMMLSTDDDVTDVERGRGRGERGGGFRMRLSDCVHTMAGKRRIKIQASSSSSPCLDLLLKPIG